MKARARTSAAADGARKDAVGAEPSAPGWPVVGGCEGVGDLIDKDHARVAVGHDDEALPRADPADTRRWLAMGLEAAPRRPGTHAKKRAWVDTW